jgi:crossover junction endodeoxyribonuclease RuvC
VTRILGVDPGLSGAFAVIEMINGVPVLVDAADVPVTGTGAKARIDAIAATEWISRHAPSMAYIERTQAHPGQGRSSAFIFGRTTGALEALVTLLRIPVVLVEPAVWKRRLNLPGKDKEAARQRALQLFPSQHALLARKRDHNRAESALLALAGTKIEGLGHALAA